MRLKKRETIGISRSLRATVEYKFSFWLNWTRFISCRSVCCPGYRNLFYTTFSIWYTEGWEKKTHTQQISERKRWVLRTHSLHLSMIFIAIYCFELLRVNVPRAEHFKLLKLTEFWRLRGVCSILMTTSTRSTLESSLIFSILFVVHTLLWWIANSVNRMRRARWQWAEKMWFIWVFACASKFCWTNTLFTSFLNVLCWLNTHRRFDGISTKSYCTFCVWGWGKRARGSFEHPWTSTAIAKPNL